MIRRSFSVHRNWKSRVFTVALCCAMFPISASFAEDFAPANGVGSKAVLFSFSGLANLGAGAINGGIGGKYFFTEAIAGRAGLQFLTASEGELPANPIAGSSVKEGSRSATQFGLNLGAEYHFIKSRVSPFFGGELSFSTMGTSHDYPLVGTGSQVTVNNSVGGETIDGQSYKAGLGFGIAALGGVEFFITKEISLGAEYQLGYKLKSRYEEKDINQNPPAQTKAGGIHSFGITNAGLLTLAIYF
jgi:hypothetical protein